MNAEALVVFLHAVGGDPGSWDGQVARLAHDPRFRTLAVDLTLPAEAVSMRAFAEKTLAAIDAAGYARAHLVGLSMGAVVALEVFAMAPERVRSLTLANTWAYQPEAAGKLGWFEGEFSARGLAGFSEATMPPLLAPTTDPAVVARMVAVESAKDPAMYRACWHAMLPHDHRTTLARVDVPMLLMGGALDTVTPTRPLLTAIAEAVPTARLVELPRAAHFSNLDDPEGFDAALVPFLREAHGAVDDRSAPPDLDATVPCPAESAAARLLRVLSLRGVEAVYANSGTDFTPVIEAMAALKAEGFATPRVVAAPHENTVIAMAHGHALVTGRAQVAMAHVNVGTANMGLGLINARRARVPVLAMAGRTPWFESGMAGVRSNFVQWGQEARDQGAMFREFTRWDYELRHPHGLDTVIDRATALAESAPQGPVYLTLPKEPLCMTAEPAALPAHPRITAARPALPSAMSLETARQWLHAARRPVVVTADAGRQRGAPEALVRFAEAYGLGVIEHGKRNFFNFPTEHPLHQGFDPLPDVTEADLVVAVECPVPWIPAFAKMARAPRVIALGVDPLFEDLPLRGFPCDLSLAGDPAEVLRALTAGASRPGAEAARGALAARHTARFDGARAKARAEGAGEVLTKSYLSLAVGEAIDEGVVIFNEYPLDPTLVPRRCPGSWFENSVASGLGWALGASLGAQVAAPERTVLAAVGDGSYLFNTPLSAHAVAVWEGLPVVTLVFNDAAWSTIKKSTRGSHPGGAAVRGDDFALCDFPAHLDLAAIARGCGAVGLTLSSPADAHAVLREALTTARTQRRPVVIDARVARDG